MVLFSGIYLKVLYGNSMIIRWFVGTIFFFLFSFQSYAGNNPFERMVVVNIGDGVPWHIKDGTAVKTSKDIKGQYFRLTFNKKQLRLTISIDEAGEKPVTYNQFGVTDVQIDGKRLPLFTWCLDNQERQNRFLRQGLSVKDNRCVINGKQGEFILQMDRTTLDSLNKGKYLSFVVKPYRTRLKVNFELTDFQRMSTALFVKPVIRADAARLKKQAAPVERKCWARPPARYSKIKSVKYSCNNAVAKKAAKNQIIALVKKAGLREKQRALAEQKKLKAIQEKNKHELDVKRKKQEALRRQQAQHQLEIAAKVNTEAKASKLISEITLKMVGMCRKIWDKGENRCYCQKYIDFAPASIKASSTCK